VKSSLRHITAVALLAIYVPLMGVVELTHSHGWPACGNGTIEVKDASALHAPRVTDAGLCVACLLSMAQHVDTDHLLLFSPQSSDITSSKPSDPLLPISERLLPARAPPFSLLFS
jgi:hypothetical protein